MPKMVTAIIVVLGGLLWGCTPNQHVEETTTLTVPGSGACEYVLKILANAFNAQHPGLTVIVPKSTGTSGGIKAVRTGAQPLGRVGRPLNGDESKGGVVFLPFANDAVVFAAGKSVGVDNLTADQLAAIFKGEINAWHQLGGPQNPIRVLIRQDDEISMQEIRRNLPPFSDITFSDQAKIVFHDYEMVDLLNKYPASIGFLTNSSVVMPGNHMQPIGIGGTFPTADNLTSGAYPLKATYGLVYKKIRLNAIMIQFIDFIFSEKGKQIIEDLGLTPLARSN